MKKITFIGTGYVGLVTGAGISDFGHDVVCVDIDAEKIEKLNQGQIPIYEPGLEQLIRRNVEAGRLSFTTDVSQSIRDASIVFIAVGTPEGEDGSADLRAVFQVCETIARELNGYKIICTKSTVPVGTGKKIIATIRQLAPYKTFDYVSNPEFLREGAAVNDFLRPDRVIIGATSERAFELLRDVYRPLYINETPMVHTNVETAEMIKYASNAFLALKISYINEVANLCEAVGADVHVVAKAMGIDGRISSKFLHPGPGFGGSCFPKDTKALVHLAVEQDVALRTIEAAVRANEYQKQLMCEKLFRLLGPDKAGKKVAVLGLSFKPNTDDVRESPALYLVQRLVREGVDVQAYDPIANDAMARHFPNLTYCRSWEEAVTGTQAVAIMTEWNEFRGLNLERLGELAAEKAVLDARNILSVQALHDHGFRFENVGRRTA
ncbi:MAG: UDP-glucose dehydrogenase family protein [Fidelibacterota bacterium]